MTERDIQGLFLVLQDKLPSTFGEGVPADDRALGKLLIITGLKLLEGFVVDINRIANALEVLAEDFEATMSWSKSVYSSHVSEVGYDEERGGMIVRWQNGKVSLYEGVPEETAEMLASGAVASVGGYLHSEIKPKYQHRYV